MPQSGKSEEPDEPETVKDDLLAMIDGAFGASEPDVLDTLMDEISGLRGRGSTERQLAKVQQILNRLIHEPVAISSPENWEQYLKDNLDDSYDWLAEFLIERGERIILVAAEGAGKSVFFRQVAICMAAGIHPFTLEKMRPIKTLTVDLENMDKIFLRNSRKIMDLARRMTWMSDDTPIDAHFKLIPQGLNLLSGADQLLFESMLEEIKPEILFLGPLYKAYIDPGGRTSEAVATETAKYFDKIRVEFNCALFLEQHAPLGSGGVRDLRPINSSVWSRWPEFGLNFAGKATEPGYYDMGTFRGSRDERRWQKVMHRGNDSWGEFPFVVDEFM